MGIVYKQFATLVKFYALLYKSKFQPFSQSPISKVQFQTIQKRTEKGFVELHCSFQRFLHPRFSRVCANFNCTAYEVCAMCIQLFSLAQLLKKKLCLLIIPVQVTILIPSFLIILATFNHIILRMSLNPL